MGLDECPPKTLFRFPKDLCLDAMQLPGVIAPKWDDGVLLPGGIDDSVFDEDCYLDLSARLMSYTRKWLTTEAMAKYVLDSMNGQRSVLEECAGAVWDTCRRGKQFVGMRSGRWVRDLEKG